MEIFVASDILSRVCGGRKYEVRKYEVLAFVLRTARNSGSCSAWGNTGPKSHEVQYFVLPTSYLHASVLHCGVVDVTIEPAFAGLGGRDHRVIVAVHPSVKPETNDRLKDREES